MFEVTIGGDGLKDFCIDSPTAATELMDEQRRDRAEFEIDSVEVGARLRYRRLAFGSRSVFFANHNAALVFEANRFDDSHLAIGNGPIDLGQVPVVNLPARLGVNARGGFRGETFGLTQQFGLVLFQGEGPNQTQAFHLRDEGRLQIQSIPYQHIEKAAAQRPDQILEQSPGAGDFSFAVLLKADPQGDGERGADQGYDDDVEETPSPRAGRPLQTKSQTPYRDKPQTGAGSRPAAFPFSEKPLQVDAADGSGGGLKASTHLDSLAHLLSPFSRNVERFGLAVNQYGDLELGVQALAVSAMTVGSAAGTLAFDKRAGQHFAERTEAANELAAQRQVGLAGRFHMTLILVSE